MSSAAGLEAGFAAPVFGAQSTFRAVMDALAEPGRIRDLPALAGNPPLPAGLAAIALTLIDHDTPMWLDPVLAGLAGLAEWMAFHLAAPRAESPSAAAFAIVSSSVALPPLADFAQGTDEYPDRSTAIILALPALTGGPARTLTGPGLAGPRTVTPDGLPHDFDMQWADNCARFPRGVDLLLVSGSQLMGLPRTTRVTLGG